MYFRETDFPREIHALYKFLVRFARKTDNNIGRYRASRKRFPQAFNNVLVLFRVILTVHTFQHHIAARLQRQVKMRTKPFDLAEFRYFIICYHLGFKRTQTYPFNARLFNGFQRVGQPKSQILTVTAEIYPRQNNFVMSVRNALRRLFGYFLQRQRTHTPARRRNYAVGTETVAAVLDFQKRAGSVLVGNSAFNVIFSC